MILILEIALGIVLGFFALIYWRSILKLAILILGILFLTVIFTVEPYKTAALNILGFFALMTIPGWILFKKHPNGIDFKTGQFKK